MPPHNTYNMGKLLVTVFAPLKRDFVSAGWRILNFCSCTQDKFVMVLAPGHPPSQCFVGQRRQKVRHPPAGGTQPPHIAIRCASCFKTEAKLIHLHIDQIDGQQKNG